MINNLKYEQRCFFNLPQKNVILKCNSNQCKQNCEKYNIINLNQININKVMKKAEIIQTIEDNIKRWPKIRTELNELKSRVQNIDSKSEIIEEIRKALPELKRKAS